MADAADAGPITPAPTDTKQSMASRVSADGFDTCVWYGPDGRASSERKNSFQSGSLRIPRVPVTLRYILNYPRWIKPKVISIGPYYYGDKYLQEVQKLKYQHAEKFIRESQQQTNELYQKIENEIDDLAMCYDSCEATSEDDKKKLATIFLLDGCFLLRFIYYSNKEEGINALSFTNHDMTYIRQDLFLLENQLPYQVLKLLFEHANFKAESKDFSMEEMIKDFVISHIPLPGGKSERETLESGKIDEPCHLLHLLQRAVLGQLETNHPQQKEDEAEGKKQRERQCPPKGGIRKLLSRLPALLPHNKEGKVQRKSIRHSFKNAQQLTTVGIRFKPNETGYLGDISFTSDCSGITGCLRLPPITIDTSTMIIFLNLIVFESSNTPNDLGVISYLCFLDSLIDHWDDVKELQAAQVLHNFLGDQREVAKFFNHVCGKLVPNSNAYKNVKLQIQKHIESHYQSKLRIWLLQCKHTYFSSPWSIIALFAAFLGLLFTAIQACTSLA
ncbi:UPF0481 protein At3g47200-like [Vitis riparia]|uniref:UPF0481 protein At3g47200-like n=1 Tax=Vitis riparia TaxID=96939 RepID=UPI00155A882D|nr:UPF0481 protein At3g47200-like [Vitis riparia]XP_034693073.1 UPF0481 protein At3g47200-like [Vitis riparia]